MKPPGTRLRALSARWCAARTMERLVDPVLADLQMEYRDAVAHGRRWRGRWIRAAGYGRFVEVLAAHGVERALRSAVDWKADEIRALVRTVVVASASLIAATLLLLTPMRRNVPADLVPYLVPQALPLTLPLAVALGILFGLRGRRVLSRRLRAAALTMALACSAASFATVVWMIPAAGQMFRISMAERLTGKQFHLNVGLAEMRLAELRLEMVRTTNAIREFRAGHFVVHSDRREQAARRLALAYHLRWALP